MSAPHFNPRVQPAVFGGAHKTGSLSGDFTPDDITRLVGFSPNTNHGEKVTMSWSFTVDGSPCMIWDWRGSRWSVFDPGDKLPALFGMKGGSR